MGTGVSHSIVTQIAAVEGVDPTALEPPLHAVVDPDALERVVESNGIDPADGGLAIEFTYRGHRVRVDGTGSVDVDPRNRFVDTGGESTEESHGD